MSGNVNMRVRGLASLNGGVAGKHIWREPLKQRFEWCNTVRHAKFWGKAFPGKVTENTNVACSRQ